MFYWIDLLNEMIIAICFQLLSEFIEDYLSYEELLKPRNTHVLYLNSPSFWRISNKMATKLRNCRAFIKTHQTFLQKSLQKTYFFSMMSKQMHILTYISYMRLLEYDYVLITYLTNLLMFHLMFLHILAMLAMDHNNRLGKRLELENSCGWLDESESIGENNISESDAVDSGLKIEQSVHTF